MVKPNTSKNHPEFQFSVDRVGVRRSHLQLLSTEHISKTQEEI